MALVEIRKLLPVGSVVLLSGAKKRLMIVGVRPTDSNTDTDYDYMGVFYPEGNMGEERYLFNDEDIVERVFIGYSDPERESFLEHLADFYENQ